MKTKLSLLTFLFLPVLSYSDVVSNVPGTACYSYDPATVVHNACCTTIKRGNTGIFGSQNVLVINNYGESSNYATGDYCYNGSCRVDYVLASSASSTACPVSLSNYNNDPTGCSNAGGYYLSDGSCVSGSDAIARIFGDPLAVSGAFLFLNGFAWTAAGILALPISGGASGAAIAYGAHAMLIGAGMIAFSADGTIDFSSQTAPPSDDIMNGPERIKVIINDPQQNTQVVSADTTTGKVSDVSTIPAEVRQRILDANVNPSTGEAYNITPMDLSGTKTTHYDYPNNTATTSTVNSDGSISTQSTPITTVSNSDGSVTTSALDSSIAPTVTGTTSPSGSSTSWTPVASSGSSGGTTGTTNTGGGSSGGTSSGTNENGDDLYEGLTLDDGSSQFGSLTDIVTSSYSTFTGGDSVEISCSNTLSFDPIYFDLMGRRFTVFSMEMFNSFPIDVFRSILLFVAAVSGLLITFSGGM